MANTTYEHKRMITNLLMGVWNAAPHLRLGQLIENGIGEFEKPDLFYIEDMPLIERLNKYVDRTVVCPPKHMRLVICGMCRNPLKEGDPRCIVANTAFLMDKPNHCYGAVATADGVLVAVFCKTCGRAGVEDALQVWM